MRPAACCCYSLLAVARQETIIVSLLVGNVLLPHTHTNTIEPRPYIPDSEYIMQLNEPHVTHVRAKSSTHSQLLTHAHVLHFTRIEAQRQQPEVKKGHEHDNTHTHACVCVCLCGIR